MQISDPRSRFGFQLVGLARRWRRHLDQGLAAAGLNDASWVPLIHLHKAGTALHQKDLAALSGLDSSSLVRLIDVLEGRGLITRDVDARDRRAKRVALTAEGAEAARHIHQQMIRMDTDLLVAIDDTELEMMLAAFERIELRLQALQREEEPNP